uniref:Nucleolar protein 10 n=1 Tax=Timema tahoe TaxID=61484 RepID=A0A7R9FHG8_9NEOP|nr:unnamed protein product [Timema tahoe]
MEKPSAEPHSTSGTIYPLTLPVMMIVTGPTERHAQSDSQRCQAHTHTPGLSAPQSVEHMEFACQKRTPLREREREQPRTAWLASTRSFCIRNTTSITKPSEVSCELSVSTTEAKTECFATKVLISIPAHREVYDHGNWLKPRMILTMNDTQEDGGNEEAARKRPTESMTMPSSTPTSSKQRSIQEGGSDSLWITFSTPPLPLKSVLDTIDWIANERKGLKSQSEVRKVDPDGQPTKSAHPARFSPEDKYSRQRITIKKRFNLLLTQQPAPHGLGVSHHCLAAGTEPLQDAIVRRGGYKLVGIVELLSLWGKKKVLELKEKAKDRAHWQSKFNDKRTDDNL